MALSRGQRLLRLREQKGADQKDVAAAIGISRPYVSRLERDAKGRNLDHMRSTLERAAGYFGVLPEYLLVEEPQPYIEAWVEHGLTEVPTSVGSRLRRVLDELQLRWGDEFGVDWLAAGLGTTPDVIRSFLSDELVVTASVAKQIAVLTGAPVTWLLDGPSSGLTDHVASSGFERVLSKALANGMQPSDLELLIDAWVVGRNAKRPSG